MWLHTAHLPWRERGRGLRERAVRGREKERETRGLRPLERETRASGVRGNGVLAGGPEEAREEIVVDKVVDLQQRRERRERDR